MIHIWLPLSGRRGGGEGEGWDKNMLLDVGSFGRTIGRPIFIYFLLKLLKKIGFAPWPDIMLSQTLIYYQRQTVKPSFNDTIVLFLGWIEQWNWWSILIWRDLVLFCFDFVFSHTRCGCCYMVCLAFRMCK